MEPDHSLKYCELWQGTKSSNLHLVEEARAPAKVICAVEMEWKIGASSMRGRLTGKGHGETERMDRLG